jgi:hypothetical protein
VTCKTSDGPAQTPVGCRHGFIGAQCTQHKPFALHCFTVDSSVKNHGHSKSLKWRWVWSYKPSEHKSAGMYQVSGDSLCRPQRKMSSSRRKLKAFKSSTGRRQPSWYAAALLCPSCPPADRGQPASWRHSTSAPPQVRTKI